MHDDPIVFALKDPASYVIGVLTPWRPLAGDWPIIIRPSESETPPKFMVSGHRVSLGLFNRPRKGRRIPPDLQPPYNDLVQFVLGQHARMAPYLRAAAEVATLGFDFFDLFENGSRFSTFCRQCSGRANSRRGKIPILVFSAMWPVTLKAWRSSNSNSRKSEASASKNAAPARPSSTQVISLPPEESSYQNCGDWIRPRRRDYAPACSPRLDAKCCSLKKANIFSLDSCAPFTKDEMVQKYRKRRPDRGDG